MKPKQVLIFIIMAIAALGLLGLVFPRNGIKIITTFEFPHPYDILKQDTAKKKVLDDIINNAFKQFQAGKVMDLQDSLDVYNEFSATSPSRIYLPHDNPYLLDGFFEQLDSAKSRNTVIHILHYGDSQIEGDRISGYLREQMQKQFGGMGPGLQPAIQYIPSACIYQNYSGSMQRYAIWGGGELRAPHRRYGLMGQVVQIYDSAGVSFSKSGQAFSLGQTFTKIRVLFGRNPDTFTAHLLAGGYSAGQQSAEASEWGVQLFEWNLKEPVSKASISFGGSAEIYGIALDGSYGVTVDNMPMRGSSGEIFTRIDSATLRQCYEKMNVGMIILQYGGNVMPVINHQSEVDWYADLMSKQIQYLHSLYPEATILYIGPSDMSKNIQGTMKTWPFLIELNEALKQTALKNGAAYWDMFSAMGGENSMPVWVSSRPSLAAPDYIHFSARGAEKIAEIFYFALMNEYSAYSIRQKIHSLQQDTIFNKAL